VAVGWEREGKDLGKKAEAPLREAERKTEREAGNVTFNLGKVCENVTKRMVKVG
jgi:hypothetical protein